MRRKTIGQNPLDQLPGVRSGKGRKKKVLKLTTSAQHEFREAILKRPPQKKEESLLGWVKSALRHLTD